MTRRPAGGDRGYIMVALLVGMAITAIWMAALLPTWRQQTQRQKEAELIFRGEQYARAIALFAIKNNGALPASIDDLVQQHYLRKKWKDPITGKDFQVLGAGASSQGSGSGRLGGQAPPPQQGGATSVGVRGVYSESTDTSIRIYQNAQQYNQWLFDYQRAMLLMGRLGGPGAGGDRGGREGGSVPIRGGRDVGGLPTRDGGPGGAAPAGGRGPGGAPGGVRPGGGAGS